MQREQFAGAASSQHAKDAYVPVESGDTERITIGANSSAWFRKDPRAMAYTASKYLTAAKMLEGKHSVLEIGCGDGFGAPIVAQHVGKLMCVDFYRPHLETALWSVGADNVVIHAHDMLDAPIGQSFDAAFALDVIEHIDPMQVALFLQNVCASLTDDGVFICGAPTLNSQAHASDHGKAGHINCMTPTAMTMVMQYFFHNVFSFGLTDGHLNQGFEPMRQYQLNLCTGPKR